MPAWVHIWATDFGFVLKKAKILPPHTEGRKANALCESFQRSCSGVFYNYQGQVFLLFVTYWLIFSPGYSPSETIWRNRADVHFWYWKHLYFHPALFFFLIKDCSSTKLRGLAGCFMYVLIKALTWDLRPLLFWWLMCFWERITATGT